MSKALQPIVFVKNGGVFANSRDIAAFFEKAHKNVLQAIDNLECSPEFTGLNFQPSDYIDQTGRTLRAFDLTKDGFAFLVMGFTGAEAAHFKEAYIARFNAMEAELHAPPLPDLSNPLLLQQLLAEHLAKRIEAEKAVETARPKVEFYDRFANAQGLYGLQNAGRVLGHPPNKFVEQLKALYLFYQGGSLVPRAEYQDRGLFKVMAVEAGGHARYQTYVTPKGLQYFAQRLKKAETLANADLLSSLA